MIPRAHPTRIRSVLALAVAAAVPLAAPAADPKDAPPTKDKRNVAIVVHDKVELLDFSGPGEVFAAAGGGRAFRVYTVGETTAPVKSQGFLTVTPEYSVANCPKPDVVVIPGGDTTVLLRSPAVMKWVRATAADAEIMFSVCTGVFVLADAGLLDGKEATTHHSALPGLKRYSTIKVRDDRRVVDNGKTVTAAGVSAGIDGALHVVARLCGKDVAERTARYMEYRWQPEEGLAAGRAAAPDADAARAWFLGDWAAAAKGYEGAVARNRGDGVAHYRLSRCYALLGEKDKALTALEKAFDEARMGDVEGARRNRDFDAVRGDARFGALFRKHARESKLTVPCEGEPGEPLVVSGVVRAADGTPLPGALVYVYHTDAKGLYSPGKGDRDPTPRLFAYLRTDPQGRYEYRTIRPASYPDTQVPQHVHYEVSADGHKNCVTEFFFADDPKLSAKDRERAGQARMLATVARDKDGVQRCTFDVAMKRD